MSAPVNGGPAFPHVNLPHGPDTFQRITDGGMTLRDYFIAHAPVEPQTWFQPTMPHPPPGPSRCDHG